MSQNPQPKIGTRLASGGRIDRNKPLGFTFNGKAYQGFAGDTLASALLANGVKRVGRSFKYHRPRAIVSAGVEEFNALVQLESGACHEPNVRATLVELYDGLQARSQNAWPSVHFDLRCVFNGLSRLLPAGFYYKTFIAPSWGLWENTLRRAAGLGTAPRQSDPDRYQHQHTHCELLVVGAGPSGLAAALAAGEAGKRVLLIDDQPELGGSLLWESVIPGTEQWLSDALARLQALDNVRILPRTQVFAYYDHNVLAAVERVTDHLGSASPKQTHRKQTPRQRLWKIRATEVVLATGAIERPLTFVNNDRPGIMLAGAVRHYVNRYGVVPGRQVVVMTNNDDAYRTALDLAKRSAEADISVGIVDVRSNPQGPLAQRARASNIAIYAGQVITQVHCQRWGSGGVNGITIAPIDRAGRAGNHESLHLECDVVAMSGGWNPSVHLFSQSGGKLQYDDRQCCFVPAQALQNVRCVGAAQGDFERLSLINDEVSEPPEQPIQAWWQSPHQASSQQWLDFQYDITVADVEQAARENFISVEHFKRYTGTGMCVDQGKTGNVSALAVLGEVTGRKIPEVGTTKFRPPYHPVTIGALVGQTHGEFYAPSRQMPAHVWHASHGAVFEDAGSWQRPSYYLQTDETPQQAITREVQAARHCAGLFEASPLGKIEVRGKDAAEFLNRIYLNNMLTLKPGKVRYGLMLNENGIIIDDGVLACLAENHYQVGTTSAGARRILLWMEEWLQCEWLDLDVRLTPVTQQWAVCTLSGPKAREVLTQVPSELDLSAEAFPHMAVQQGILAGVPARIFRVSFTGEISYEINVPAQYGLALWQRLMEAGASVGITPYGIEALEILRTEKGYLHVGTDTDGTTCPDDVGWGGPVKKKPADFIGKRSLARAANTATGRLQFVGLAAADNQPLPIGGHLIATEKPVMPIETQGYVTSSHYSPSLNRPVALGLLKNGRQRTGEQVTVYDQGHIHTATVVSPVFYDSEGGRLNA